MHRKVIEPRVPTPSPIAGESGTAARLPDDLLEEQAERLGLLTAVGAGLWTTGLVVDHLLLLMGVAATITYHSWRSDLLELLGVCNSVLMFLYVRYGRSHPHKKIDVGLAYLVFNALLVSLFNTWAKPPDLAVLRLSWTAVAVLIYSIIAPASPRKMAVASLIAASMDPLGIWLAHLRGLPVPTPLATVLLFWPNYVCAVFATFPSRMLNRLGRHMRRERDLGSYHLVELLGHGGMGEVWRAQHQLLPRPAAIKLVRPEVLGASSQAEVDSILRRFEREAQATAALSSPHSIQLFDFGVSREGTFFYVMELLVGRDLESLVREFGPVPAARAVYLLRQVCHSLADAHVRDLVHRDIKPANIYACRMGLDYDFVKVLDFGLVKFRHRDVPQTMVTSEHTTSGTPAYMAPEVILGDSDVDRRADVYALGCVAYFLLTGHTVFEADTPMNMLFQHVHERPVPPSQRTELQIPAELDQFVLACLEKNPANRPQDAEELFRAACRCKTCDGWTNDTARAWWEQHLPELSGPLALVEPKSEAVSRTVVIQ